MVERRASAPGAPGVSAATAFERLPLLAAGLLSLLIGALAGLARSGLGVPVPGASSVALHGPLMIGAFLGTVISLERGVAHGAAWAFAAAIASAAGAVAIWLDVRWPLVPALQLLAGALLTLVTWRLHRRQPALHTRVLLLGAACWPLGTVHWLASGNPGAGTVAWTAFLTLTIAAERLELSRFMPRGRGTLAGFWLGLVACLAASIAPGIVAAAAEPLLGAGCLALAAWLARHDIARRTARLPQLAGFIGRCLLAGYLWLAAGGLLLLAGATASLGPLARDAALHALLLGFVMSMVLGHAPVILPAVLRVRLDYHPMFYLPLVLLHASLIARVAGGLAGAAELRAAGAAGNALALAVFLLTMVSAVVRGALARRSAASSRS